MVGFYICFALVPELGFSLIFLLLYQLSVLGDTLLHLHVESLSLNRLLPLELLSNLLYVLLLLSTTSLIRISNQKLHNQYKLRHHRKSVW